VKPATVIGWHRTGFRFYWRWRSRPHGGRPKITEEIRVLIRRLAQENQGWGAPKIHGELQKLGLVVSERSVARYLRRMRRRGDPAKRWLTFLQNHREVIAAFDFFTVPTVTFQLLYCFFRDRAWTAPDSALQRHETSNKPLDRSAAPRSVSVRVGSSILDLRP